MKNYDKQTSKYIMYLDANNLYGCVMSKFLPTSGFKWMIKEQTEKLNLSKYTEDSKEGLMLQVDPDYPQELHNIYNNHPLAAEKINVKKTYCQILSKV